MNMNENPTKDQLRELLSCCQDTDGHHICWVNNDGEVHVNNIGDEIPASWANRNKTNIRFRIETFQRGNGYVGKEAASDNEWVERLFAGLVEHHKAGTRGYTDSL